MTKIPQYEYRFFDMKASVTGWYAYIDGDDWEFVDTAIFTGELKMLMRRRVNSDD